ncbi:MAG TPA: TonB-dependent receptor, partial [Flavihumibacter sp.]|nr:TonB-dependent receptor [Flavihumibacter sp.]
VLNAIWYNLQPGRFAPEGAGSLVKKRDVQTERALESALYLGDNWTVNDKLSISAGIRYSVFNVFGPANVNEYAPGLPRDTSTVTRVTSYAAGKLIKTWQAPEIRLGLRYSLGANSSVKVSYNSMQQYIHMLSNTVTISPTDIWKLSDRYVRPQQGQQISVGYYQDFKNNTIELSIEGYYKKIKHFLDYKSGASLLMNEHIETDLINTRGKAWGVELLLKKTAGRVNGWFSYTYSRTMLQQDDALAGEKINRGEWYPASFDKPHNLNMIANYRFSHRLSMSANMVYTTGRPITLPIGVFNMGGTTALLYSDRNQYRIPDYFRADFSITLDGNHKVKQKFHNSWSAGVYNLTSRENPYSVYFVSENSQVKGYQLSIFGAAIPFVTYNIKF